MENRPGAVDDLTRLYRDAIKQHAANPVGFGRQIEASHRHEEFNPLCGDRVLVLLRVVEEQVEAAAFEGEGCAICMASASLLCEQVPGKLVTEVQQMQEDLNKMLIEPVSADLSVGAGHAGDYQRPQTKESPACPAPTGKLELQPLLGVKPFPSRIRCATLPWVAAVKALSGDSQLD